MLQFSSTTIKKAKKKNPKRSKCSVSSVGMFSFLFLFPAGKTQQNQKVLLLHLLPVGSGGLQSVALHGLQLCRRAESTGTPKCASPMGERGVSEVPWGHSPQPISCPAGASHIHQPRAASALKSHLKRNQGLIHPCLKMVFSHILLLARPPSRAVAPHPRMGSAAAAGGPTPAPSGQRSCHVHILSFIGFFFFPSFPLFYPFCTTTPWGPSRTSGQATSGSIYWRIIYLWTRREKRPNRSEEEYW